jgi:hypothetical protein
MRGSLPYVLPFGVILRKDAPYAAGLDAITEPGRLALAGGLAYLWRGTG